MHNRRQIKNADNIQTKHYQKRGTTQIKTTLV